MKIGAYEFTAPELPSNDYYIFFDLETGEIYKITNEFTEYNSGNISYITEDFRTVKDILEAKVPLKSRKVVFNTEIKSYELEAKESDDELFKYNTLIHEIERNDDASIQVVKDNKHTCWKFFISSNFKSMLIRKGGNLRVTLLFSITEKHNPNLLYKTLRVPFKELFDENYYVLPFTSNLEFDRTDFSLYTMKQFDSYSFEVINE